ncbi:MAG: ADP-ribosylglycohydrolase family protein, partial [Clostridia bacterium]|nr:ADP-ribosylglycohydrolase family protein [Clostridia bacterium]
YNIDAKLNAAYILVGLLWGEGDFEQSMIISGRCGQDSDCNPSSVASILGNFYGAANIPEKWKKGLNYNTAKFSETNYTLNDVIALNYELMSEVLLANGATLKDGVWTITKDTEYKAVPFEQWTDEFDAGLIVTSEGNGVVKLNLVTNGNEKIKSIKLDMGDGFVAYGNLAKYAYAKTGEYTIKYTVVSESGKTVSKERKVIVEDSLAATPICSVTAPTGGGNKDMNVMFDGYTPYVSDSNSALQYDTYDGGKAKDSVYAGLEFSGTYTVSALEFTEGKHFNDGGWFAEVPTVEVLVNGVWKAVEATSSYPSNNTKAGHGNNFDKYVFTLKQSVACQGIRLNGKPGGSAYFISVGEFNPVVVAGAASATFDNNDIPLIISNVTAPKGSCNHDILIIADGKTGTGNADQYNTYVGVTPGVQTYFGYLYKTNKMIKTIEFTEGNHWNNDGGWFENGIRVEVLVNGEWKEVEATCEYPIGDSFEAHGNAYETFVISLKTLTTCRGVRIVGEAGGPNGFVSISELTVK